MIHISGHSDDTVQVEALEELDPDDPTCSEFETIHHTAISCFGDDVEILVGTRESGVVLRWTFHATWSAEVRLVDEGVQIPWPVQVAHCWNRGSPVFSVAVQIDCPVDTPVSHRTTPRKGPSQDLTRFARKIQSLREDVTTALDDLEARIADWTAGLQPTSGDDPDIERGALGIDRDDIQIVKLKSFVVPAGGTRWVQLDGGPHVIITGLTVLTGGPEDQIRLSAGLGGGPDIVDGIKLPATGSHRARLTCAPMLIGPNRFTVVIHGPMNRPVKIDQIKVHVEPGPGVTPLRLQAHQWNWRPVETSRPREFMWGPV